jgi:hypothetical protein
MSAADPIGEFSGGFERLERAVVGSCDARAAWPDAVAAGVYAALEFAADDPATARLLTDDATARWHSGEPAFVAMVARFAVLLDGGAPPRNLRLPGPQAVVTRIARQVNLQLEAGGEMMEIAPDLTFLALLPYLGFSGARQWSHPTATA